LEKIIPDSAKVIGIDISPDSLKLAQEYTALDPKLQLVLANAKHLPFSEGTFDKVVCIQNGISAFKIDPIELVRESVRVTTKGGVCMFSSYSERFWNERLKWFQLQAQEGLIGEIDMSQTADGVIVCKDGFKATTFTPRDFHSIAKQLDLDATVIEVDESSVFCLIKKK